MHAQVKPAHSSKDDAESDAITMLTADHKKVKALFADFAKLAKQDAPSERKATLVSRVCDELKIHAQIEEEIFYPAVRAAIDDDALMDEADVEHACAKDLIGQLDRMDPSDDHYDAKVTVLGEQIQHHVKEEEGDMFPKARKAKVDLGALGAEMSKRKSQLMAGMHPTAKSAGTSNSARKTAASR